MKSGTEEEEDRRQKKKKKTDGLTYLELERHSPLKIWDYGRSWGSLM